MLNLKLKVSYSVPIPTKTIKTIFKTIALLFLGALVLLIYENISRNTYDLESWILTIEAKPPGRIVPIPKIMTIEYILPPLKRNPFIATNDHKNATKTED